MNATITSLRYYDRHDNHSRRHNSSAVCNSPVDNDTCANPSPDDVCSIALLLLVRSCANIVLKALSTNVIIELTCLLAK